MTPRTLRCANFHFYLGVIILVLAACVYALLRPEQPLWQSAAAVAGMVVTLLWGGSYLLLRYTVDEAGVVHRTLFGSRSIRWADVTSAELEHKQTPGVESKTVILHTAETEFRIGSDLLDPDAVDALAEELQAAGILPRS